MSRGIFCSHNHDLAPVRAIELPAPFSSILLACTFPFSFHVSSASLVRWHLVKWQVEAVTCMTMGLSWWFPSAPSCVSSALGPHCHPSTPGTFLPAKMRHRGDSCQSCGHFLAPAPGTGGLVWDSGKVTDPCESNSCSLIRSLKPPHVTWRIKF